MRSVGLLLSLFLFLIFLYSIESGKILVGYAPQANSHFRTMLPLINKLASAGHEVTVFHTLTEARQFSATKNIRVIPVEFDAQTSEELSELGQMIWASSFHGFMMLFPLAQKSLISMAYVNKHPNEVLEVLNGDWDLIIGCSLFNAHMFAFAEALARARNIPYVVFQSTIATTSMSNVLAMGDSFASTPNLIVPEPTTFDDGYDATQIWQRISNVIEGLGELLVTEAFVNQIYEKPMRAYGVENFDLTRFLHKSSFFLCDMPEYINFASPQIPNYKSIGANCAVSKPLPRELAEFLEDPTSKGTIYIAFGTLIPWDYAPAQKRTDFFDALDQLTDYRIIFSYKGTFPKRKMPPHFRLVKWAPQFDILAHKKTKIFLTHGGLKSFKEGLCAQTPLLVMPMFSEQVRNSKLIIKFGLGGALNKYTLTRDSFLRDLQRILNDADKYLERTKKLHAMYLDRPIAALDGGEFFTSRLIRLKQKAEADGTTLVTDYSAKMFFKQKGMHLNVIEHFYIELFIVFLLIFFILSPK